MEVPTEGSFEMAISRWCDPNDEDSVEIGGQGECCTDRDDTNSA